MPQRVHTMRGPIVGTGTSSSQLSALSTASWWHRWHDTASDRTPLARMLPSVIGSIGSLEQGRPIASIDHSEIVYELVPVHASVLENVNRRMLVSREQDWTHLQHKAAERVNDFETAQC
jgi:hypothetical protein